VLQEQDKSEAAIANWHEALRLKPEYTEAHNNLASTLVIQGKHQEARTHYDEALRIDPGYANAHANRALLALLQGDLAQGWEEYEWRWRRPKQPPCLIEQPMWQGESLFGRTILLHAEQGLGDTLQFVRYAPLVKARTDGRVLLECPLSLGRLLNSCPGIDQLLIQGKPRPPFDVHAPLLSFAPDWRWLLDRSDSPWYPSLRLFRQPQPGKWDDVFDQIGRALCEHRHGYP